MKNRNKLKMLPMVALLSLVISLVATGWIGVTAGAAEVDDREIVIKNNTVSGSGVGIYVGPRSDRMLIIGNTIKENAEGVRLTGVQNENIVKRNKFLDNLVGISLRDTYSHNEKGLIDYPVNPEDISILNNWFENNEEGKILNLVGGEDKASEG